MNHLDLFSGIGGFALAGQQVWKEEHHIHRFIEIDKFCQKVLKKHWPDVLIHSDIRTYKHDETKIDLLTGGFPCQPFSVAGKQRGKEDDRYLWPEMLRVIAEVKPTWVIGENVVGIVHMELDQVLSDLEAQGYETQAFIIPACAVDAPHRRDRVWILAYSVNNSNRTNGRPQRKANGIQGKHRSSRCSGMSCGAGESSENVADAESFKHRSEKRKSDESSCTAEIFRRNCSKTRDRENWKISRRNWSTEPAICELDDGFSSGLVRYRGRIASDIPNRVAKLKALGNAIVPQVVMPIMQAIKEIEKYGN